MEQKRKYIVLTILVAMIAVAGYLNWTYNDSSSGVEVSENIGEATMVNAKAEEKKETSKDSVKKEKDEMKAARETKDTSRSKAMETLNGIINDANIDPENKEKASADLVAMAGNMEAEGVIEGILKTKGYSDCVVFITGGNVTVSVKCEKKLTSSDAAKIQDAVKSNTEINGDKITITQIK